MKSVIRIALIGAIAVLVLDTVASLLALWLHADYGWFSLASFGLYVIFGYLAAKRSRWFMGPVVAMFMAVVESTLGWAISWQIGPGKPTEELGVVVIVVTIALVAVAAGFFGLIGGALSLLKKKHA